MEGLILSLVFGVVTPIVEAFYPVILPVILAALTGRLWTMFGHQSGLTRAEFDKIAADALHNSIGNGLKIALAPFRGLSERDIQATLKNRPELLTAVVNYVLKHNPDAVKRFKLDSAGIVNLMQAHLPDAMSRAAAVPPTRSDGAG